MKLIRWGTERPDRIRKWHAVNPNAPVPQTWCGRRVPRFGCEEIYPIRLEATPGYPEAACNVCLINLE